MHVHGGQRGTDQKHDIQQMTVNTLEELRRCWKSTPCLAQCTRKGRVTHSVNVHVSESVDDCCTAEQQHGSDQDVRKNAEEEERQVGRLAPARICTAKHPLSAPNHVRDYI